MCSRPFWAGGFAMVKPSHVERTAIIQGLWVGPSLSLMEQLSIASFLANGHQYHLYVYDDVKDVPSGTRLEDASTILPHDWMFLDSRETFAAFSDMFRYKLLLEKGGWWVDTDMVCVRPFEFDRDCVFSTEPDSTIGSAVIRVPPGSQAMSRAWASCVDRDRTSVAWGSIGPRLLIQIVRDLGLEALAVEPEVFFPFDWGDWQKALDPTVVWQFAPTTRSVHLWSSMWDLAKWNKDATYPDGCLYETLKRRYLPR